MPDADVWYPELSERGWDVFNSYERTVLVCGARKGGKTIAICHKVWRHLWETPGARVGLFSKTIKSAKDGGVWSDLVEIVGPQWINSNMVGETGLPIAYTTMDGGGLPGPKVDGQTRTLLFKIRNKFGGESELRLFSLDHDQEVEAKVKNLRFSLIWFSELSNFKTREVLNVSILSLRMPHLDFDRHQWIADTNPAKEGKDSWIYKLWYIERLREQAPITATTPKKIAEWVQFKAGLALYEFFLDDNPFLDVRERIELEGLYSDDPGEYDRNVLGKWTRGKGGKEKHFSYLLKEEIHFVEDSIDIPASTTRLIGGWDIGEVNHAAVILEERLINGIIYWMAHEELVYTATEMTIKQFAFEFFQKMTGIETFYKRSFTWKHWSDDSSTNRYRPGIDGFDADQVKIATEGKVELEGALKPAGSITASIRIIRRLLKENRLFVSRTGCPQLITMLQELEQPDDAKDLDVDPHNPLKHIFDALRYPIYMESLNEAEYFLQPRSVARRSGLFSIGT
jgi:PBSX family phage terminase large subunit